jgi:hypothetical protein
MLSPAAVIVRALVLDRRVEGLPARNFVSRFPAYFGLIALNFIVLAITVVLAQRLIGETDHLLAFALGAAIVTGDLVHGLFWTQHANFLNLLIPIGGIFYFVQGCKAREMSQARIALHGLAAGATILAYGYALIWLPAFVLGALYRDWRMSMPAAALARNLARMLPLFALAGLGPPLAWIMLNVFVFHLSVSAEAETFRQLVWMLDAWQQNDLGAALRDKWRAFFPQALLWAGWPALAALVGAGMLLVSGKPQSPAANWMLDPILLAIVATVSGMLVFNYLQGYYQPRLTNGIALALFVAIARCAQISGREQLGAWALLLVSAGQIVGAFLAPSISLT